MHRVGSDKPFYVVMIVIGGAYAVLLAAMAIADAAYLVSQIGTPTISAAWSETHPVASLLIDNAIGAALADPHIRRSVYLTLISCTISTILSLWVAIPVGYLMARRRFWGRRLLDALFDIPIVLPPLVVGLSLLILFHYVPAALRDRVVYQVPAVVLSQFVVACAFSVRTLRATFDQLDPRREHVALTLGCSRFQALGWVVLPEIRPGLVAAGTLAWARSLGEFGPLLVFAGATRGKTEVLSTSVFLELSIGNLAGAVGVSFLMIGAALIVLIVARVWGDDRGIG